MHLQKNEHLLDIVWLCIEIHSNHRWSWSPEKVISNDGFDECARPDGLLLVSMPSSVAVAIVDVQEFFATPFAETQ